jgi:hypothetical protein
LIRPFGTTQTNTTRHFVSHTVYPSVTENITIKITPHLKASKLNIWEHK